VLLVAGAKDHGPGEHDYPAWLTAWSELLRGADGVNVDTAMEWPTAEQIAAADTIAFFQKGSWNAERARAIDQHLSEGKGLVYIHWAVEAGADAPAFAQRIGLASNAAKLKFRHGPLDLGFESGSNHPIGRNFETVHFHDESYWQMQGDLSSARVIASGLEEGEPRPLFWTLEPRRGKVFVSIPGHYSWTFDDPLFRILLLRGLAWTANESVDRFNELATIGVKLAD
jgi:type 1 glutamine amidotransferase